MSVSDPGEPEFPALLRVAEANYKSWRLRESRPEWDRRLEALKYEKGNSSRRASLGIRIYRELLEREARQRILCYAEVARKWPSSEMLSKRRIDEHRERIMSHVRSAVGTLKDSIERGANAAGDVPKLALPPQRRYDQLQYEILDIVDAELGVLEAEGNLSPWVDVGRNERREPEHKPTRVTTQTKKRRSDIVRKYRHEHDLTMADLARRFGTNSTAIYGMIKGDQTRYGQENLEKFLHGIGVSAEQWAGR